MKPTKKLLIPGLLFSTFSALAQKTSYPLPNAAQQAGIEKDNGRHFGDSPLNPGPLASDLSPILTAKNIDKALIKVADWQLARSQPYWDQIWTSSVMYAGFMAASDATGNPKYREAMASMSKGFDYGFRNKLPNADDQSIAQTYLELYLFGGKKDAAIIKPTLTNLDSVIALPTLRPGDPRIPWWWCDALFMAPPVWVRAYAATGDHKYIDYVNKQWVQTSELVYDKDDHLYARDASYVGKLGPTGKNIYADGRLGNIQQTGAEPTPYYPGSSYNYGVGGFMLAASELKHMVATETTRHK